MEFAFLSNSSETSMAKKEYAYSQNKIVPPTFCIYLVCLARLLLHKKEKFSIEKTKKALALSKCF